MVTLQDNVSIVFDRRPESVRGDRESRREATERGLRRRAVEWISGIAENREIVVSPSQVDEKQKPRSGPQWLKHNCSSADMMSGIPWSLTFSYTCWNYGKLARGVSLIASAPCRKRLFDVRKPQLGSTSSLVISGSRKG
nr:hypothetical protein Iba_chr06bCG10470 [Ipomoea batatas]